MDLSWDALSTAMARGQNVIADAVRAEIDAALDKLAALDPDAAAKARAAADAAPNSRRHLSPLLNRINAGVAQREAAARESAADNASPDNTNTNA